MASPFKDFIPDGEEKGAQGQVFKDFVPEAKPVLHPVEEVTSEEKGKSATKKAA